MKHLRSISFEVYTSKGVFKVTCEEYKTVFLVTCKKFGHALPCMIDFRFSKKTYGLDDISNFIFNQYN